MPDLLEMFPDPKDFLALEPDEWAGILIEIIPGVSEPSYGFVTQRFTEPMFSPHRGGYEPGRRDEIELVIAEAILWLMNQEPPQ